MSMYAEKGYEGVTAYTLYKSNHFTIQEKI